MTLGGDKSPLSTFARFAEPMTTVLADLREHTSSPSAFAASQQGHLQLTAEKLPHTDSFLIPVNNVYDAFNPLFSITYAVRKLDRWLRQ